MLFYFNRNQIDKIREVASVVKKDVHSYCSSIAKEIIEKVNFDNLQVNDNILIICDDARIKDYNSYTDEECQNVAEEIKEELKRFLGVDSEVKFYIAYTAEEEPDPIPPLYWGETNTVYYYGLTVKVKL